MEITIGCKCPACGHMLYTFADVEVMTAEEADRDNLSPEEQANLKRIIDEDK